MDDRLSLQTAPEPMPRRQPDEEAGTRPGGVARIAALIGAIVALAAVALVALGWLSMAVSVLAPVGAPLDEDVHFVEAIGAAATMPPDLIGEAARPANRTSTTYPSQRATPFPANGQPARDED
jgi:hypothetical protein